MNRSPMEFHDKLADMLCFKEKYHDSGTICGGDTGSPVISTRGGSTVQFGIAVLETPTSLEKDKERGVLSFPAKCDCHCPEHVQYMVDVRLHLDWIHDKLWRNNAMPGPSVDRYCNYYDNVIIING